jgi:hypothetical protein
MMRLLRTEPTEALVLPVRDIRVLYGLKLRHYESVARAQVPHPHEYFCPIEALTAERGHEDPALTALIGRASAAANFMFPARQAWPGCGAPETCSSRAPPCPTATEIARPGTRIKQE